VQVKVGFLLSFHWLQSYVQSSHFVTLYICSNTTFVLFEPPLLFSSALLLSWSLVQGESCPSPTVTSPSHSILSLMSNASNSSHCLCTGFSLLKRFRNHQLKLSQHQTAIINAAAVFTNARSIARGHKGKLNGFMPLLQV